MPFLLVFFAGIILPLVAVCRALLKASIWFLDSSLVKALTGALPEAANSSGKPRLTVIQGDLSSAPKRSQLN